MDQYWIILYKHDLGNGSIVFATGGKYNLDSIRQAVKDQHFKSFGEEMTGLQLKQLYKLSDNINYVNV